MINSEKGKEPFILRRAFDICNVVGVCPMTKKELRKTSVFELEPFLVGVLHYILKNRIDKNQIGLSTLDFYGNKKARKEREHKGNAGQRITRGISVDIYEIKEDESESQIDDDSIDKNAKI